MISKNDYSSNKSVSINIRFACWRVSQDRSSWPDLLAGWLGRRDDIGVAGAILSDMQAPIPDQIERVAAALNADEQDLVFANMPAVAGVNVLHKNLERLFSNPGKNTKGQLAEQLEVDPATLSRWIGGKQAPDTAARRRIAALFGLGGPEELDQNPIFLSYLPVTHAERIAWVNSRLQEISLQELRELFPAFYRMLSRIENHSARPPRSPR
jgi:hypothetical protein